MTDFSQAVKNFKMSERARPSLETVYGTLPSWAVKEYISRGIIKVFPLPEDWEKHLDQVTIDFHLGSKIRVLKIQPHTYIDIARGVSEEDYDEIVLKQGGPYLLKQGQFIIAETRESLVLPDDIVGRLEGKSSLARVGIVVHFTAGRFDPGWSGIPVLELKNNVDVDVIIYEGWPICAFSFDKLMAPVERPYSENDRYSSGTVHSQIHKTDPNS